MARGRWLVALLFAGVTAALGSACALHPTGLGAAAVDDAIGDDTASPLMETGEAPDASLEEAGDAGDDASEKRDDAEGFDRGEPGDAAPEVEAPPPVVARLNVDGQALDGVDFPGRWSASPVPGTCGPNRYENGPIHGTNDVELFGGEAFGNPLRCSFGGSALSPGTYRVRLYFAELWWGPGCPGGGAGAGSRLFSIALEGKTVLTDFDVFAASGGCMASTSETTGSPVVQTFDVAVTDGTLDLVGTASKDNANLTAIEILGPL